MNGLYSLKPWYAQRLRPVRDMLIDHSVSPHAISAAGVLAGAGAGVALAMLRPGPLAAVVVAALLAARLAFANLDGSVARQSGRTTRMGSVVNELGDRLAEFAALAGCLALAPPAVVVAAALAATAPSWISLAGAAAGANRITGGPVGKTERCLLLVVIAGFGAATPILAVLAAGSLITAGYRMWRLRSC
jgi:CDP-diacylglycerol--glycerol-3-phosphate 3-phosphatidyltransferase